MHEVDEIPWDVFLNNFYVNWQQGEHVALVGPTGGGKTTLAKQLLPRRRYVAILATKPRDATLSSFKSQGYERIKKWPPKEKFQKVLLWPPLTSVSDVALQRDAIADCLHSVFRTGGWCLYFDELRYVTEQLKLEKEVELLWLQGRALGISLVTATQRPANVPLVMYDQSTHLFFWRDNDERNLKRISGIGWLSADLIRETVARLPKHAVLYVNTRTGDLQVTKPERV